MSLKDRKRSEVVYNVRLLEVQSVAEVVRHDR